MELCGLTLQQYIHTENDFQQLDTDKRKVYRKIKPPADPSSRTMPIPVQETDQAQPQVPFSASYIILQHILNGLLYIHCLGEVNRDLSPHNGMTICFELTGSSFQRRPLEDL
jgi:hypothetical protein